MWISISKESACQILKKKRTKKERRKGMGYRPWSFIRFKKAWHQCIFNNKQLVLHLKHYYTSVSILVKHIQLVMI